MRKFKITKSNKVFIVKANDAVCAQNKLNKYLSDNVSEQGNRVLYFEYSKPEYAKEAEELQKILSNKDIPYIFSANSSPNYVFYVAKPSNFSWNTIYSIINNVKSARYRLKNMPYKVQNGKILFV